MDEEGEEFANESDDNGHSICMSVPYELERVDEEDEEYAAQQPSPPPAPAQPETDSLANIPAE